MRTSLSVFVFIFNTLSGDEESSAQSDEGESLNQKSLRERHRSTNSITNNFTMEIVEKHRQEYQGLKNQQQRRNLDGQVSKQIYVLLFRILILVSCNVPIRQRWGIGIS